MSDYGFAGFGAETGRFFAELRENNSKTWFDRNRDRYVKQVRDPAEAFVLTFGAQLKSIYPEVAFGTQRNGSGSILRINRDIRFSPDKRPYKTHLGLVFWIGEGKKVELPCFYLHVDTKGSFFYGGRHMFPKGVLARYREAVADETQGEQLVQILSTLTGPAPTGSELRVMEDPGLKRVPRGYPSDHPRADLLRYAGIGLAADIDTKTLGSADLVAWCLERAERLRPLIDWLRPLNG